MTVSAKIKLGVAALLVAASIGAVGGALAGRAGGGTAPPSPPQARAMEQASALRRGGLPQANAGSTGDDVGRMARLVASGADPASGRVLLSHLGASSRSIYAFPQSDGEICLALSGATGGCVAGFDATVPVDSTYGRLSANDPVAVWGLAPDDVTRVRVDVRGSLHVATLRNNAYYFELPDVAMSTADLTALVLTYRDGSTSRVLLH